MFVRQNQQQFRNSNADVQVFYGELAVTTQYSWNKPPGVSQVYIMLIGGGGSGDGASIGGGSGAVTTWYGAAKNVPDSLIITPSKGNNSDSTVSYKSASSTLVNILTAAGSNTTLGAVATASGPFGASGFYQSVAGDPGSGSAVTASNTTFLSPGPSSTASNSTANYGYSVTSGSRRGFFLLQPIIVACSGATSLPPIGCGGVGAASPSYGGPGMILIASW